MSDAPIIRDNLSVDNLTLKAGEDSQQSLTIVLNMELKNQIITKEAAEKIYKEYKVFRDTGKKMEPLVFYAQYKHKKLQNEEREKEVIHTINRISKLQALEKDALFLNWHLPQEENLKLFSRAVAMKTILRLWNVGVVQFQPKGLFLIAGLTTGSLDNAEAIIKKDWAARNKYEPIIQKGYFDFHTWKSALDSQTKSR